MSKASKELEYAKELCKVWKEEYGSHTVDKTNGIIIVTTKSDRTISNYWRN